MAGFYGRVIAENNSSMTFDRVYPNRVSMDAIGAHDGVYTGRFVLVEYDNNAPYSIEELGEELNLTEEQINQYNEIYTQVEETDPEMFYNLNYNIDKIKYSKLGRGYDSTVWRKVIDEEGNQTYVMLAELNSVVPTFDIRAMAPSEDNLTPHFDPDSSNVYYALHMPSPWRFELGDVELGLERSAPDEITLTSSTSGTKYYDHNAHTESIKEDTKLLNIKLPSIGQTVQKTKDFLYGEGNTSGIAVWLDADNTAALPTPRMVYDEEPASLLQKYEDVENLVGTINATHDIMGMILHKATLSEYLNPGNAREDWIYYFDFVDPTNDLSALAEEYDTLLAKEEPTEEDENRIAELYHLIYEVHHHYFYKGIKYGWRDKAFDPNNLTDYFEVESEIETYSGANTVYTKLGQYSYELAQEDQAIEKTQYYTLDLSGFYDEENHLKYIDKTTQDINFENLKKDLYTLTLDENGATRIFSKLASDAEYDPEQTYYKITGIKSEGWKAYLPSKNRINVDRGDYFFDSKNVKFSLGKSFNWNSNEHRQATQGVIYKRVQNAEETHPIDEYGQIDESVIIITTKLEPIALDANMSAVQIEALPEELQNIPNKLNLWPESQELVWEDGEATQESLALTIWYKDENGNLCLSNDRPSLPQSIGSYDSGLAADSFFRENGDGALEIWSVGAIKQITTIYEPNTRYWGATVDNYGNLTKVYLKTTSEDDDNYTFDLGMYEHYEPKEQMTEEDWAPDTFWVKNENDEYVKDTGESFDSEQTYYVYVMRPVDIVATGTEPIAGVNSKGEDETNTVYYIPDKLYKDDNGSYVIATESTPVEGETYYKKFKAYVKEDPTGNLREGENWNPYLNYDELHEQGVVVAYQTEESAFYPLNGYARDANTINGWILKMNRLGGEGDPTSRDEETFAGLKNLLQDYLNKLDNMPGNSILVSDEYGHVDAIHKKDGPDESPFITEPITTSTTTNWEGFTIEPYDAQTNTDGVHNTSWISATVTSTDGNAFTYILHNTVSVDTSTGTISVINFTTGTPSLQAIQYDNAGHVVGDHPLTVPTFTGDDWTIISQSANVVSFTHSGPVSTNTVVDSSETATFGGSIAITKYEFDTTGHMASSATHTVTFPTITFAGASSADGHSAITGLDFDASTGSITITRDEIATMTLSGYDPTATVTTITDGTSISEAISTLASQISSADSRINNLNSTVTWTNTDAGISLTVTQSAGTLNSMTGSIDSVSLATYVGNTTLPLTDPEDPTSKALNTSNQTIIGAINEISNNIQQVADFSPQNYTRILRTVNTDPVGTDATDLAALKNTSTNSTYADLYTSLNAFSTGWIWINMTSHLIYFCVDTNGTNSTWELLNSWR